MGYDEEVDGGRNYERRYDENKDGERGVRHACAKWVLDVSALSRTRRRQTKQSQQQMLLPNNAKVAQMVCRTQRWGSVCGVPALRCTHAGACRSALYIQRAGHSWSG